MGEYTFFGDEEPSDLPCPPTVDPNRQLGMQVHLPILNYIGNDDRCNTWIEVQNVGSEPVKAVLVTWGEPGFCPPQAAGPLKVECTGLLKPGSTWNFVDNQIPTGSKSGMLFKFSTRQLSDDGLDAIFGFDDIFADLMCETLFFGVVGDCDDYRRFKKAYNEGGTFAGIPLDLAAGFAAGRHPGGRGAARLPGRRNRWRARDLEVQRHRGQPPGDVRPGVRRLHVLRAADLRRQGGLQQLDLHPERRARVHVARDLVQGAGRLPAGAICDVLTLAPGETYPVRPERLCRPGLAGQRVGPRAPAAGHRGGHRRPRPLHELHRRAGGAELHVRPDEPYDTPGNQVNFGPLIYSEYQGWDTASRCRTCAR